MDPKLLSQMGNRMAARGMIAVSETGVPGIVISNTKVEGTYRGVSLVDGTEWVSSVPTFVGRFVGFLDAGLTFEKWCADAGAHVRIA